MPNHRRQDRELDALYETLPKMEFSAGPCGAPCVGYPNRICHLPIGHDGRHQALVMIQWADNSGPEDARFGSTVGSTEPGNPSNHGEEGC